MSHGVVLEGVQAFPHSLMPEDRYGLAVLGHFSPFHQCFNCYLSLSV